MRHLLKVSIHHKDREIDSVNSEFRRLGELYLDLSASAIFSYSNRSNGGRFFHIYAKVFIISVTYITYNSIHQTIEYSQYFIYLHISW